MTCASPQFGIDSLPASWVRHHLAGGRPLLGAGQPEVHGHPPPRGQVWSGRPCSLSHVFISQAELQGSPRCSPLLITELVVLLFQQEA